MSEKDNNQNGTAQEHPTADEIRHDAIENLEKAHGAFVVTAREAEDGDGVDVCIAKFGPDEGEVDDRGEIIAALESNTAENISREALLMAVMGGNIDGVQAVPVGFDGDADDDNDLSLTGDDDPMFL